MIARVSAGIEAHGFRRRGVMESPLKGDKGGNTEFLALFVHEAGAPPLTAEPRDAAAPAQATAPPV